MIAENRLNELPSLESLPDSMKCRVVKALRSLAEVSCCAGSFGSQKALALLAPRVADLMRTGATSWDCQWLLMAGCIRVLKSECHRRRGKNGCYRASRRLDEQALVMITDAGDAELRRLLCSTDLPGEDAGQNGDGSCRHAQPILHYDAENRELFVGCTLVLPVRAIARNLDTVLRSFEAQGWKQRIACPFKGLSDTKRAQTVRDAVYGLNTLQKPQLILFHSDRHGARIWYEMLSGDVSAAHGKSGKTMLSQKIVMALPRS